jgi:signal transduction histidine kinase
MTQSLRRRAVLSGALITLVSVVIGGVAIYVAFDAVAQRQFNHALAGRQLQVLTALERAGANQASLSGLMADPAYSRPYSGTYWEAIGPKGELLTSRSLFDGSLPRPAEVPRATVFYDASGPERTVRIAARTVTLTNGEDWQILVAQSFAELNAERAGIRRNLLTALGIIGLIGIAGSLGQTAAVLRPLGTLRAEILKRWQGEGQIEVDQYPTEVQPLVAEINALLHRNRDIIDLTRRQGADLAHALKTPSSILRNELEGLRSQGLDVSTAETALERIDAQIRRALARVRAVKPAGPNAGRTSVDASAERLLRLFRSLPAAKAITIETSIEPSLHVTMDAEDLAAVLGNLLDNAMKWGKARIRLSAQTDGPATLIVIEDDGPGIPEADTEKALRAGGRLDTSVTGTGLGLSIAADLVQIYDGTIQLSRSATLGGLKVTLRIA